MRAIYSGAQTAILVNVAYASSLEDQLDKRIAAIKSLIEELDVQVFRHRLYPVITQDLLLKKMSVETLSLNLNRLLIVLLMIVLRLAHLASRQMEKKGGCLSQNKSFAQTIDALNLKGAVKPNN